VGDGVRNLGRVERTGMGGSGRGVLRQPRLKRPGYPD
jgi:hypothetical protein